jgi:hypothetical protein
MSYWFCFLENLTDTDLVPCTSLDIKNRTLWDPEAAEPAEQNLTKQ